MESGSLRFPLTGECHPLDLADKTGERGAVARHKVWPLIPT
jgi:hypothetical protein